MPLTPVRPPLTPTVATPAQRPQAARQAQRAFFDLAAGKVAGPTPAPVAAAAPAAPKASPITATRATPVTADAPSRILRPGSLLDIKV